MTRLPLDDRSVVGYEGPSYTVSKICAVDGCSRRAEAGGHHIWRRSFLAGPYDWVKLPDGRVVGNKIGLCNQHHNDITENRAKIIWNEYGYLFDGNDPWEPIRMAPQPPTLGSQSQYDDSPNEGEATEAPGALEECPTCHRKIQHKHEKKEKAKVRKAWTIHVPKDEQENGADVLDTLLRECAILFRHDEDNSKTKYFTLAMALALVVQHGPRMMSDD